MPLVLLVVLLAGCSITGTTKQAPPKTLSQGRFDYLVERATRRLVCRGVPHRKPTSFGQARANLKRTLTAYEHWLFTLRGLAPPTSEAVAFDRLLGAVDRLDLVLHRLVDAVDERNLRRIKIGLKQMHRLMAQFNKRFHVHQGRGRHGHQGSGGHFACTKK